VVHTTALGKSGIELPHLDVPLSIYSAKDNEAADTDSLAGDRET